MKTCLRKNLYMNVYNSSIHNSPRMETTQMSISWWMHKQSVAYPHGGIFGHKREDTLIYTTTWMDLENMLNERSQSQRLYVTGLQLSEICRIGKSIKAETRLVVFYGLEWWGDRKVIAKKCAGFFLRTWNVLKLTVVMAAHICDYTKANWIVHLKWANCITCKIYSSRKHLQNPLLF